jgi:hypothetical protein
MDNICILQVDVKPEHSGSVNRRSFTYVDDLYHLSKEYAKLYAKKVGADYHLITDRSFLPNKHAAYQRLKCLEMEYDYILYLDSDCIVYPDCPNLFQLYSETYFAAVSDIKKNDNGKVINIRRKQYEAPNDYIPFCSGVMLMSRKFLNDYRDRLNEFIDKDKHWEDQEIFNRMIIDSGKQYDLLDDDFGAWYSKGYYVDHIGTAKKTFSLEKYMKKNWSRLCPTK